MRVLRVVAAIVGVILVVGIFGMDWLLSGLSQGTILRTFTFAPEEVLLAELGYPVPEGKNIIIPRRGGPLMDLPSCFDAPQGWFHDPPASAPLTCQGARVTRNSLQEPSCNPLDHKANAERWLPFTANDTHLLFVAARDQSGAQLAEALLKARALSLRDFAARYAPRGVNPWFHQAEEPRISYLDCDGFSLVKIDQKEPFSIF